MNISKAIILVRPQKWRIPWLVLASALCQATLAADSPKILWSIPGFQGATGYKLTADGKRILVVSTTVKEIDIDTGQLTRSYRMPGRVSVWGVPSLSHDENALKIVTSDTMSTLNLLTGQWDNKVTGWFRANYGAGKPFPGSFAFNPDSSKVLVGGGSNSPSSALVDGVTGSALKVLLGNGSQRAASAVSADGVFGAVSGFSTKIIGLATGNVVHSIATSQGDLSWYPATDKRWIAIGRDVWDVGGPVPVFVRHLASSGRPYFSPDGALLHFVEAGKAATYRTTDWSLLSNVVTSQVFGGGQSLFMSDGRYLSAGSSLGLFDGTNGEPVKELTPFNGSTSGLTLTSGGRYLIFLAPARTGNYVENSLHVVDAKSGRYLYRIPRTLYKFAVSRDESTLAAQIRIGNLDYLRFYRLADGSELSTMYSPLELGFALVPDGTQCLRFNGNGIEIQRYRTSDGAQLTGASDPRFFGVMTAGFTPDGQQLMLGQYEALQFLDLNNLSIHRTLQVPPAMRYSMFVPSEGNFIYLSEEGHVGTDLRKVDTSSGVSQTIANDVGIVGVSADGSSFVTSRNPYQVLSTQNGSVIRELTDPLWRVTGGVGVLSADGKTLYNSRSDLALFAVQFSD